jgi:hypothetical protein
MSNKSVPPWERGSKKRKEAYQEGLFESGCLAQYEIFIPVAGEGRRSFSVAGVTVWALAWFVWFAVQVGAQAWYMFAHLDVASTGTWFLQLAGISLDDDRWWSVAIAFVVSTGIASALLGWLVSGITGWLWVAVVSGLLYIQSLAGIIGSGLARVAMYARYGPDEDMPYINSVLGRGTDMGHSLYISDSPNAVVPGLVAVAFTVVLAVIVAVARAMGVSAHKRGNILANVVALVGLVGMLVVEFGRTENVILFFFVIVLGLVFWWIPGEFVYIRRCVTQHRDALWQCQAGMFIVFDLTALAVCVFVMVPGI